MLYNLSIMGVSKMKQKNTFSLSIKVMDGLKTVSGKTGIPQSQQLERAWLKVYGKEAGKA